MTKKICRDADGAPIGFAFFETGKGEIEGNGFTLSFEARFEFEQTEHGWVSVGFDRLERITIQPDGDVAQDVPYPQKAFLHGWTTKLGAIAAILEAEQDAERRANQND
jgi:hypothetical protein